ncbi:hypothetical protein M896_091940 [Ordospora colligata OC4]|uniref:Transmembrane protein n=1 Tax=Ordospora colligata OC4 TaxID=1354746 RepID=A0A0B2UJ88_9MICR|nr:uncharacterized protein M896_091940 [Ordospora colligata OC4]KHN69264.1 hypothetical protein M896_091940 [Ordospora colligata OC4]TBU14442.1 hypothetical protein CWI40_091930 [Ordospora colligata]TBU14719.1 hypothetical protein CWI41_091940 [Ordospora colligata]
MNKLQIIQYPQKMEQEDEENIKNSQESSNYILFFLKTILWPVLIFIVCVWQILDRQSIQERIFIIPIMTLLILIAVSEIYSNFVSKDWICICMNVVAIIWYAYLIFKFISNKLVSNPDDTDLSFLLILFENLIRLMVSNMQFTNRFRFITYITVVTIYGRLILMIVRYIPKALEEERSDSNPKTSRMS